MKPSFRVVTTRKILLGTVALVCAASTATAALNEHETFFESARSYPGALSINPASLFSETSSVGALTLDNVYAFDFASVGMGSLVFRAERNRAIILPDQDAPRASGIWNAEPNSTFD